MHIVADLSHLVATGFTTSICTVGVFGTKYVRDGDALPTSLELTEDSATETLTVLKKQWLGRPLDWTKILTVPASSKHETHNFRTNVHGFELV